MDDIEIKNQFEEVYEREVDALFRYCLMRIGNRNQAIDIAQDAFVVLWQAYQKGETIDNPQAYLFTVLKNRIIDWYRKKKSVSLDALTDKKKGQYALDPADQKAHEGIIFSAEAKQIIEAINSLEPNYREAVYLRLVEDLPPPEIAALLGSKVSIVSVRITRGIQKLRKNLNIENNL